MGAADVAALTAHLDAALASPPKPEEERLLEAFAQAHAATYSFEGDAFAELHRRLVRRRFLAPEWATAPPDYRLRVLQCLRLMVRDATHQAQLVALDGVRALAGLLARLAEDHLSGADPEPFSEECLIECASVVRRLASDHSCWTTLVGARVHTTLVGLLRTSDGALLPLLLVSLISLSAEDRPHVEELSCVDLLVRMLEEYELPFKRLAADLINLLCRASELHRREFLEADGLTAALNTLHCDDEPLVLSLLHLLSLVARDVKVAREIRHLGGVPIVVSLLGSPQRAPSDRPSFICAVCSVITKLSLDDESAYQIRRCNAVYLLGRALLERPATRNGNGVIAANAGDGEAGDFRAATFRALRFVFSVERNRKVFKRVFPPDLFVAFIDVGHYRFELSAYAPLIQMLDQLSGHARNGILSALEEVNQFKGSKHRVVRGYVICELLGKGAFGSVYQCHKQMGGSHFAMKELPIDNIGLFGATADERNSEAGRYKSEVAILSTLEHPNIVKYYESFVEGDNFCIVMELVEGASLLDYINSLTEKRQRMEERLVWQIFIQLTQALHYIHVQKGTIHRDLTPSNVMLEHTHRRVKIADFGLAKQKQAGTSVMQSAVGTMPYSCPEIIQHERYSDKADVWSLGCVLYHMIELSPPFSGDNPLTLASKIVECQYVPPEHCTEELRRMVVRLLTTDPQRRPSIKDVAAENAPRMMLELDRMRQEEDRLKEELAFERERFQKQSSLSQRTQEAMRRLFKSAAGGKRGASPPEEVAPAGGADDLGPDRAALPRVTVGRAGPTDASLGPSPKFSVSQRKLRQIDDPYTQILSQLHKLIFLDQLPPRLERDVRRRWVERFKRHVFAQKHSAGTIKSEIVKLLAGSRELIELDFGGSASVGEPHRLTYEALQRTVEELLVDFGFYGQRA